MDIKPKKVMSPETLEKLKYARIKALEVRQRNSLKMKEINELEKKAIEVQHMNKVETLKKIVEKPNCSNEEIKGDCVEKSPIIKAKITKENKLKKIIENDSNSSNSDESDKEDLIKDFLKTKYKQKYKNKYESKTITQLTKGLASNHVKSRLNDEMIALASKNIFG